MKNELIEAAATIAAALIARMPATGETNNQLTTREIKDAFLQAREAVEDAMDQIARNQGRSSPRAG